MVIIDTDVFLLEFAFHRDARYEINADFLKIVRNQKPATTIYNLMEILGQLSFNLSPERLNRWHLWLQEAYGLAVIWPESGDRDGRRFFYDEVYRQPLAKMQASRMAFLDALVIGLAERTPDAESFITWNAKHFRSKTPLPVLTPPEFLAKDLAT
jgi:hypothetical protein